MSEVIDIVGDSPAVDTDATVAIVWADGTYTTEAGTFHGGREEAMATVALVQAKGSNMDNQNNNLMDVDGWVIVGVDAGRPAFWSNAVGWIGDRESADVFQTTEGVRLPTSEIAARLFPASVRSIDDLGTDFIQVLEGLES